MTANEKQVGGTHYKTAYEHWDLMLDFGYGVSYLVGQATKYVTRWRKKNGLEDLLKALHFVNKLIENRHKIVFNHYDVRDLGEQSKASIRDAIERYAGFNQLNAQETEFCELMVTMDSSDDLFKARDIIVDMLEQWDREHPRPVPLEDSNKHADRADADFQQGGA